MRPPLLLSDIASNSFANNKPLDALIIGAGWAGLGAARHLLLLKDDIVINDIAVLEGRNYIGGRSRTVTLEDGVTTAEVGSQWVQGIDTQVSSTIGETKTKQTTKPQEWNPIFQAVLDAGISFAKVDESSNAIWYYDNDNPTTMKILTEHEQDKLVQDLFDGPHGFVAFQEKLQDKGKKDCSLREIADKYIQTKKLNAFHKSALEWMLDSFIVQEYGANLEDLSHWWWDSDEELLGGDVYLARNVESGFTGLVEHYAAPIRHKICLDTTVTAIDWTNTPVEVKVTANSLLPTGCNDDDDKHYTILANHVIVTVSLGVLQQTGIDFTPNLPRDKLRAIDKLGMGLLNKCTMLWDDSDVLPWPHDKEWIERIAAPGDQGRWTEFYNPGSLITGGQPLLYAYLAGQTAELVEDDRTTDEQIKEEILQVLSCMFGTNVPEPRQILISRWGQDEFSRGAYSYNRVGSSPTDRKALARPVCDRLYFAGEATHSEHFATAQGALSSGILAAKRIVAKCKQSRR